VIVVGILTGGDHGNKLKHLNIRGGQEMMKVDGLLSNTGTGCTVWTPMTDTGAAQSKNKVVCFGDG
jgi:hypothetical protein